MKKIGILLVSFGLVSLINAVDTFSFMPSLKQKSEEKKEQVLNSQYDFKLIEQAELREDTKIRTDQILKEEQDRIEEVIYNFNVLEDSLVGFEERYLINKVKSLFIKKYFIKQTDLLEINNNLNDVIRLK